MKYNKLYNAIRETVADIEDQILHSARGWALKEVAQEVSELSTCVGFHNSAAHKTLGSLI